MAHLTHRVQTFKLDNAAGTLTALTGSINSASLAAAITLLEDIGLGDDNATSVPGIHRKTIPFNCYLNTTTEGIFGPLLAARTSITKTVEYYNGVKYYNGEVWVGDLQQSGAPDTLQVISGTFTFDGACNRTSVALS